jgi:hypothetical protein
VPSESFSSAHPTDVHGRGRSTCATCKRTVCTYVIDGKTVVTDTEKLAVVADDRGPRAVVFARRLHNESCAKYEAENEREKIRKEKAEWDRKQQQAQSPTNTTLRQSLRRGTRTRGM